MQRVRRIQGYLKRRIETSECSKTVFDSPHEGCFAQRFFDEEPEAERLRELSRVIRTKADQDRDAKEKEWTEKSANFERLTREIEQATCTYISDTTQSSRGSFGIQKHDPGCRKCEMDSQRRSMKIQIFEEPLPTDDLMAKVAVFELGGYHSFETYRDLTWLITVKLGVESVETPLPHRCSVREYTQLRPFATTPEPSFRLVSTTKSCRWLLSLMQILRHRTNVWPVLKTHWATVSVPVALSEVLRANGLRLAYFDVATQSWPRNVRRPSFSHHCALRLPSSLTLAPLVNGLPHNKPGPSSYEVIASQAACPPGVNLHEYLAIQGLLTGNPRRWITLLTELGSSNINFSTEATAIIVSHLTSQCGPLAEVEEEDSGLLGKSHSVFQDDQFRTALLRQMTIKLEGVASNWREVFAMDIIITITTRALQLSRDPSALEILCRARLVCFEWVRALREETRKVTESETAKRYQITHCGRHCYANARLPTMLTRKTCPPLCCRVSHSRTIWPTPTTCRTV
jgi:hypothetical protein